MKSKIFKKKIEGCILLLFFLISFYADFGPLNLGVVHRYCTKLNRKLNVN